MSLHNPSLPRRYPGLRPFERSQSAVFHGRHDDIAALTNLVLRERLVVLFAKSGMGKTSLLQAGCAPEMERQDFVPIFLRTERSDRPLLEGICEMLDKDPHVGGHNDTGLRPHAPQTLWEKMKRLEFDLNGLPATPVLVFDQFEETFTLSHSEKSRQAFFQELADLANETMPESLRADLLEQFEYGNIDVEAMQWWERQPDVRIVLSIRSDFLHTMDRVSKNIPGILRNRYELLPLDRDKARSAIVMPAAQQGEYASPPFLYEASALEEMLDFLSGRNAAAASRHEGELPGQRANEIEAVNLQIICQDVEERIIDFQQHAGFVVDSRFYEGKKGLSESISNFYQNQLELFPKAYVERILQKTQQKAPITPLDKALSAKEAEDLRETARKLIEESLITPGNRRNSVVDDTLISEYQVTPDFLDTLVDKSRLLRKEPRLDDFYYEISHDTLLPAIIESRNARRDKEQADRERAAYQAKLEEEARRRHEVEAELKATRRQRKLARWVAATSFLSLLVTLGFAVWFVNEYVENARGQLAQAEFYVSNELYNAADHAYQDLMSHPRRCWVLEHTRPYKSVGAEYEVVRAFQAAYIAYDSNFVRADSLMLAKNYAMALHHYRISGQALDAYSKLNSTALADTVSKETRVHQKLISGKRQLIQQRISNASQTLSREFRISQREYESFHEAKVWGQALRNLRRMKQLLPLDPEDEEALRIDLKIDVSPSKYVLLEMLECERMLGGR